MEYKINTISDILNAVNSENIDNFLIDFELFLRNAIIFKTLLKSNPSKSEMTWIDDGQHKENLEIKLIKK